MNKKLALQCIIVCFLSIIIITNSTLAFADTQVSNAIGTLQLYEDKFVVSRQSNELIKVFGSITATPGRGDKVTIVFTFPDGEQQGQQLFPLENGYFETFLLLDKDSQEGWLG